MKLKQIRIFYFLNLKIQLIMAIIYEKEIKEQEVIDIAKKMLLAARTAPKAKGIDTLSLAIATGDDIKIISDKLKELAEKTGFKFFIRDAENILQAQALVMIGTKIKSFGLDCGYCGFKTCAEKDKHPDVPCVFNTGDLGIAIGSAVSIATDNRIDNRIMFSVGKAIIELGIFDKDVKIVYAMPLSATGKNPFFDRKKK